MARYVLKFDWPCQATENEINCSAGPSVQHILHIPKRLPTNYRLHCMALGGFLDPMQTTRIMLCLPKKMEEVVENVLVIELYKILMAMLPPGVFKSDEY